MSGRYFFIISLFFAQATLAGPFSIFFLKDAGKYSAWELERIESFLAETEKSIPLKMKKTIGGIIPVDFITFTADGKQGIKYLLTPTCGAASSESKQSPRRFQTLGRANLKTNLIELNRLFLNEIFLGEVGSQKFDCRHRSHYRTAMATLIHEVGHLYDDLKKVTSTKSFQNLMGFKEPWLFGKAKSKNKLETRSVNPYEFTDLQEAFSVNLEHFLLDPEFACRRPNINQFYEEHFGVKPELVRECAVNYLVDVKDSTLAQSTRLDLNPERLYSVDYLLADRGSELMSYWGHAMFNLIFCAPDAPIGANCRDGRNLAHHVVVSFRANLTDLKLSYLKGLFGGYPSQPFLLSMVSVMREYNRMEKRNLISIPLKMTALEKTNFVNQVVEMYSSYMGEFYFLTNNCATETKDLIKTVVRKDSAQNLGFSTPVGLVDDLIDAGLIDRNYKKLEYSRYDSYSEKYKDAFTKLLTIARRNKFKDYDLEDFIELPAKTRMAWYTKIIKTQKDKRAITFTVLQLEQEIKEFEKQSFDRAVYNTMLQAFEKPAEFKGKFKSSSQFILNKIVTDLKRGERFNTNSVGYGVFLPQDNRDGEFERIMQQNTQRDLVDNMKIIRDEAELMYAGLNAEIKNTGENITQLIKMARETLPTQPAPAPTPAPEKLN